MTKVDKAGAGVIGAAVASIATHYMGVEMGAAIGTLITGALVWIVRNQ